MKLALFAIVLAVSAFATPAHALGANSDKNLKEAVAFQVTADTRQAIAPDTIKLVNVKRGMFRVTWEADAPNGRYSCTSDDMLRNPRCIKLETATLTSLPTTAATAPEQKP